MSLRPNQIAVICTFCEHETYRVSLDVTCGKCGKKTLVQGGRRALRGRTKAPPRPLVGERDPVEKEQTEQRLRAAREEAMR